ncbi:epsin-1-like isoform X2 [Anopheles albimanus]|uniref:epsin-1-like isoform X2 n=1 Tax=Anopheles albimanus TaxID=7167 RepID=UPI00163FB739|nr:epsin-1-like isoform X2 [Anopheles albimanus]XP_035789495.1 epsin-1-like isoform X2 [Anopheles albimanus]XP_035789496.1 epsin-1-like isoform X2 [Anopheles albimanus]XP_035789497.1 epsin-1-like isoform X2 [Anopheles albimanus]XP_035789498.1 epsin-1-like isoform X2 [Anopheles albimanus]XP_035789499.1 epsin-1-like isoform X2 [Anopheles albimanus]
MKKTDTQMNVAGIRRNIKNLAHNYSDAQIKVREATSNDPWGPSSTIMAEIADLTYNVVAFSEIMQMIWKRMNDHGKNWRHVYKALLLLEYLIKTGTEKVAQQCKENIFAIQTLKEFQYLEEGKDQGMHVREKAKQLVSLLKDDERLKNERARALKAKERFARTTSAFGSDGSMDGPTQRDSRPPNWGEGEPIAGSATSGVGGKPVSEIEFVRPQTVGEEELQLQLAMAMSREEAEQEEQKRRSDDVRLQLALSQSEQDFKTDPVKQESSSALVDLLDISFGATSISSPSQQQHHGIAGPSGSSAPIDPWGMPVAGGSRPTTLAISRSPPPHGESGGGMVEPGTGTTDPWSRTSSPPAVVDPWLNTASALPPAPSSSSKPPLLAGGAGGLDAWQTRTQSPSVTSGSSVEGWLHNGGGGGAGAPAATNGNVDPWLSKTTGAAGSDPWQGNKRSTPVPAVADPWQPSSSSTAAAAAGGAAKLDPWAPVGGSGSATGSVGDLGVAFGGVGGVPPNRPSPVGALTSPVSDLDEFDIITKRAASNNGSSSTNNNYNHNATSNNLNNNSSLLLGDLDPLSSSGTTNSSSPSTTATGAVKKTPQSFLGENSALVNLDNLIKPMPSGAAGGAGGIGVGGLGITSATMASSGAAYNPFGDSATAGAVPAQKNLFQQNQPQVPSINQLKQSPFPVTLNQDPWAPVSNMTAAQLNIGEDLESFPYTSTSDRTIAMEHERQSSELDANANDWKALGEEKGEEETIEDDIFNTSYAFAPAKGPFGGAPPESHLSAEQLISTRPLRQLYDFHFAIDADDAFRSPAVPDVRSSNTRAITADDACNANINSNYDNNLNNNNPAPWMNPQSSNPFLS